MQSGGAAIRAGFIIGVLLLALAGGGLWFFQYRPLPDIAVIKPEYGTAVEAAYATGSVEATVMMPISPRSTARLMELGADEGQSVTKGQVLARLEDDNLQKNLDELRARENFARKTYQRRSSLVKQGYESKLSFEQARAELDAAIAAVAQAEAELSFLRLVAPADGLIIRRDGEVGQTVVANQPVFWMACCAPLRVTAEVDEEDVVRVHEGQKVLIRADAFSGEVFEGRVQAITPKGDPVARSYRVRITLPEDTKLRIGMTVEANIILTEKDGALLISTRALVKDKSVWLVRDGRLVSAPVTIGIRGPLKTEIIGGVMEHDMVVAKPSGGSLKEGRRVRAAPAVKTEE